MTWIRGPGDQIVLREIWQGRVWSGRPYSMVEDTPDRLVMYACAGISWMRPVRPDGSPIRGFEAQWKLEMARWPIETLRIVTPATGHSVLLLWTEGFGEFLKWYVNLEAPLVPSAIGFDYLDNILDIEVAPDLSSWRWKDVEELEEVVARSMFTPERAKLIRAEGERAIRALEAGEKPFNEHWPKWRPDPRREVPGLPEAWSDLHKIPATGGQLR